MVFSLKSKPNSGTKRIKSKIPKGSAKKPKKDNRTPAIKDDDEEILSDDPDVVGDPFAGFISDEENGETSDQKRIRLAQIYLEEIENQERERAGESSEITDLVNARIHSDDLEGKNKLRKEVADRLGPLYPNSFKRLKHKIHKLSITALVISNDSRFVFSASKDCGLVKWSLKDGSKLAKIPGGRKGTEGDHLGHCTCINALAISSDGKFLASGDNSNLIHLWNPETMELIKTFKGHRDSVSGLAFRINSHTLFSCAFDRSVKLWNCDDLTYIETLFGHQDKITGIDAGIRERAITSGGRDGSVRVWKIVEESQLVFNGPAVSTDLVRLINEEHFVTCGEDGHISLWGVLKKKPLATVKGAHGMDSINGEPMWISALATYSQTDLIATGSRDGFIRFWKCGCNFRSIEEIQKVPVVGFVNSLAFASDGSHLIVGVGQEHRLGRWWRIKEAVNSILFIPLNFLPEID